MRNSVGCSAAPKKEESKDSSDDSSKKSSPFGGLLGGGSGDEAEEAEAEPTLIPAAAWLAMDEEGQAAYVAELARNLPRESTSWQQGSGRSRGSKGRGIWRYGVLEGGFQYAGRRRGGR